MADGEYKCFIYGLSRATTDEALFEAFRNFGDIAESKVFESRSSGFVTFRDEMSMRDAIRGMDGQELDGRNILVKDAPMRRIVRGLPNQ